MLELSNITSPAFINRIGMGSKKIIHRIVLVRHGETISNLNIMNNTFEPNKKHLNTPLSNLGHQQAKNVFDYLTQIGFIPDRIIISRLERAHDTAKPFIENFNTLVSYNTKITEYNYSHDEEINDNHGRWTYKKETYEEFIKRINEEFTQIKNYGSVEMPKQTIIFTHSHVISTILTNSIFNIFSESNIFFHLSNCSITCLDIDENNKIHIHAVNYTKHLNNPTGQHSPFV